MNYDKKNNIISKLIRILKHKSFYCLNEQLNMITYRKKNKIQTVLANPLTRVANQSLFNVLNI